MDPQPAPQATHSFSGLLKILAIALMAVLLVAAAIFGFWAYGKMNHYKNLSDAQINAAADQKVKAAAQQLQDNFDAKNVKTYNGSPTYGSVSFNYPKSWSAYVDTTNTSQPINGYFYPDVVPGTTSKTAFAIRVELLNQDYSQILQQYTGNIQIGKVKSKAYIPPKMKGAANVVTGSYLTGAINLSDPTQNGEMVITKVRDMTLRISTQSPTFFNDFNNIILSSLTFAP